MLKESDFRPLFWLKNSHLQTLWATLLRRPANSRSHTERLILPDGDFLDLEWTSNTGKAIVVILHGLEGSAKSNYVRGLFACCVDHQWQAVAMHFRGCSGEPNLASRAYHSGETTDLHFVLQTIRTRYPDLPIFIVGFSLGGNVLLKYLGQDDQHVPVTAAIAVSVPFKLNDVAIRLEYGFSRLYQWHLVRKLKRTIVQKANTVPLQIDLKYAKAARTFREYDDRVTAPLHGFEDVDDYYTRSSSHQFLKNILTPTLILHARDDAFMTDAIIPAEEELSDSVTLEVSEHGGHVGFISGRWLPEYWLEKRICAFIQAQLKEQHDINDHE